MAKREAAHDHSAALKQGTYLTFRLKEEEYGIAILDVKEIIGIMAFTPIPKTPDFVKGVINLRGKVIPVIDLRLRFGLEPAEYDQRTCIIVVEVPAAGGDIALGLVVDTVNEVANVKEEDVEETPSFGFDLDTKYILGMAKAGGRVKILLDIARVLGETELAELSRAA
jgi:purine-binding chemotaxis protein CheW